MSDIESLTIKGKKNLILKAIFYFACMIVFATIALVTIVGGLITQFDGFGLVSVPRYLVGITALAGAFWVFSRAKKVLTASGHV